MVGWLARRAACARAPRHRLACSLPRAAPRHAGRQMRWASTSVSCRARASPLTRCSCWTRSCGSGCGSRCLAGASRPTAPGRSASGRSGRPRTRQRRRSCRPSCRRWASSWATRWRTQTRSAARSSLSSPRRPRVRRCAAMHAARTRACMHGGQQRGAGCRCCTLLSCAHRVLTAAAAGGLTENDFIVAAHINAADLSELLQKRKARFWA